MLNTLKILGAVAVLSATVATQVFAQAAIQEPGAYAFYHPNSDLGIGTQWPQGASNAMASDRSTVMEVQRPARKMTKSQK